ncbi:MAG: hypothetical protein ACE1ZZ_02205 [Dehalococcoidia bacterium]
MPSEAIGSFAGVSGDGAPLGNLLVPLGVDAQAGIIHTIGKGILTGSLRSPAVRNPIC